MSSQPYSVLICHNRYRQRGGEDVVFRNESELLRARGHKIQILEVDNSGVPSWRWPLQGVQAFWNHSAYRRLLRMIDTYNPDVVHCHNTFPLISPSVYYAATRRGIPVLQTLHNYRLLCPGANLFRAGKACELCVGRKLPLPAVPHACYRSSRMASAAATAVLAFHNALGTWSNQITLLIALTEFARDKFIEGGFNPARIVIKPNFVSEDFGPGMGGEGFILYAGRLSQEKGLPVLLSAWEKTRGGRLLIAGDGPLVDLVRTACSHNSSIQYMGSLDRADLLSLMGRADAVVLPSECYEGLPGVLIESFSCGTPVVGCRLGSIPCLIRHRENGWLVKPGDPIQLAEVMSSIFSIPEGARNMRAAARAEFESRYSAEANYRLLMDVYSRALAIKAADKPGMPVGVLEGRPTYPRH